jgi:hypothetical protein
MARPWQETISRDEFDTLLGMSDWWSWLSVAVNWALAFTAMALVTRGYLSVLQRAASR